MKCKKCKTTGLESDLCDDCLEEQTFKEIKRQLLNIEVWNCNTKTKFVFSTLTRITDVQQITDAISEALNRKELHK